MSRLPPPAALRKPDIVVSAAADRVVAVQVADCAPILTAHRSGRVVAASHAGWRGTATGVAGVTVGALSETYQAAPDALSAAIGPCIGPCCYEVGEELVAAFGARAGARPTAPDGSSAAPASCFSTSGAPTPTSSNEPACRQLGFSSAGSAPRVTPTGSARTVAKAREREACRIHPARVDRVRSGGVRFDRFGQGGDHLPFLMTVRIVAAPTLSNSTGAAVGDDDIALLAGFEAADAIVAIERIRGVDGRGVERFFKRQPIAKHASVMANGIDGENPPPGLTSVARATGTPPSIIRRAGAKRPSLR